MAEAHLINGKYLASAPELVGNLNEPNHPEAPFLTRIQRKRRQGTALIGLDFPIGLPKAYARNIGARQFPDFLKCLETESEFFKVCRTQGEISLNRPFYPFAPGGKRQGHLTNALGLNFQQLLRTCDEATGTRPEASALFWTLGAKQVGKAAIVGWRDVLAPALRAEEIKLWPFDGPLDSLLKTNQLIAAETYPAQYYASIFGHLNGSKTNHIVRAESAPAIFAWAASRSDRLQLDSLLRSEIQSGFHHGDDAFDATIGLFGMIDAIQTYSPALEQRRNHPQHRRMDFRTTCKLSSYTIAMPPEASLESLKMRHAIPGIAEILPGQNNLPKIRITTPAATAEIYLHGAQITSWQPAGEEEVLFLSSQSRFEDGKAIRGGIPLCFPWFRAKADNPKAPAHGLVRTRSWQLDSIAHQGEQVVVTLSTASDDSTRLLFPHDYSATLQITVGAALELQFTAQNTGESAFQFEVALHTYNRVGDVQNLTLTGLDQTPYLDNRDNNALKLQAGQFHFTRDTDNAYLNTQTPVEIQDPVLHRRIRLEKQNSLSTVVWNPWAADAAKLSDLAPDEWTQFACVEAANILSAAVTLHPGERYTTAAQITVHPS